MELFPASLHTHNILRADTRIPDISAYPQNPDPVHGAISYRSNIGKIACNQNISFFLTPFKFYDSCLRVSFDSTLESSSCQKSGKAVQLVKSCLGFHNAQHSTAFKPNVSSFKGTFTV